MNEADRRLLVEAVNGCYHENGGWSAIDIDRSGAGDLSIASYRCVKCGRSYQQRDNPTFSDPSELGPLILWAVKWDKWEEFWGYASDKFERDARRSDLSIVKCQRWLFQSTEHFAELLAGFLREKGGEDG